MHRRKFVHGIVALCFFAKNDLPHARRASFTLSPQLRPLLPDFDIPPSFQTDTTTTTTIVKPPPRHNGGAACSSGHRIPGQGRLRAMSPGAKRLSLLNRRTSRSSPWQEQSRAHPKSRQRAPASPIPERADAGLANGVSRGTDRICGKVCRAHPTTPVRRS